MAKRIYLSHFINEDTPIYGGVKNIKITPASQMTKGDSANTHYLSFSNHTGTHIDFPRHFTIDGKISNDYPANFWFFDHPFLLDFPVPENTTIDFEETTLAKIPTETDFLIVRTGFQQYRAEEKFWKYNPGVAPELAGKLKKQCPDLQVIGLDFISLSGYQNRPLGRIAHKAFLKENDILIVEDMDLEKVNQPIKSLTCFPLMIDAVDGVPVTIIATLEN